MSLVKEAVGNRNDDLRKKYKDWSKRKSPATLENLLHEIVNQIQILNTNMSDLHSEIRTGKYNITN